MFQITLKAARVNAELTIKEAAKAGHVTPDVLRNYESGRTVIPAHVLMRLAKVYGIQGENIRLPIVEDGEFDEDEKNLNYTTV